MYLDACAGGLSKGNQGGSSRISSEGLGWLKCGGTKLRVVELFLRHKLDIDQRSDPIGGEVISIIRG